MDRFLTSNETFYRLMRTIVQGVLGVIVANLDFIVGLAPWGSGTKALIVALVMAILSPIMSLIGEHVGIVDEEDEDEEDEDFDEDMYQLAEMELEEEGEE